jgi:hypothetical protein
MARGQVSVKLDAYSFGVVLLELLLGQPHPAVHEALYDDEEFFANAFRSHADRRPGVGAWPEGVATGVARTAEALLRFRAQRRATVQEIFPGLEALLPTDGAI